MRALISLFSLFVVLGAAVVQGQSLRPGGLPADVDPGELQVLRIGGREPDAPLRLPLRHTDVRILVNGFVARATVTQHYENPYPEPIEAVYAFPLPDQAAVDGMTMKIGDKRIRGLIKRREEARRTYEQALADGRRAALLEQERPNVFTQSVGNVMPGEAVEVEITYVDILAFRDEGAFELVFPMVVGPRYVPGTPIGGSGRGRVPDTDQVPDASRITPPVLKPGERSGHDVSLSVDLDAAVPVRGLHSASHAVDLEALSPSRRRIHLHPSDTLPNKDFVLRYEVADKTPLTALITHHTPEQGGYFTLITLPPQQVGDDQTLPRDLIFILDTSGSMRGLPLDQSKQAMERLIDGMRPSDRFNIVRFAGDTGTLWPEPKPKTAAAVGEAKAFVARQRGGGGTEMRRGIVEALGTASDPERLRIAVLLTDGYVGNEEGILAALEQERRGARVFSLGVGSSVNRYLLDRVAQVGLGEAFYLRQDEDATATIERFFKRVDRPALAHVQIDWDGVAVTDLTPARLPDLWQGQPIRIHGRYGRGGTGRVTIRGRLGKAAYERQLAVELPQNQPENALMATVWARARVKELMLAKARGADARETEARVTALGLEYAILTPWTSFVAVEEKVVNRDGKPITLVQPVEMPEGVSHEGVFGEFEYAEALGSAPAPVVSRTAKLAVRPLSPPMVGAAAPRREAAVRERGAAADEQAVSTGACPWRLLSVSGGLRFARVDSVLRAELPALCRTLAALDSLLIELKVQADGSVAEVRVKPGHGLAADALDALRERLRKLGFGPVAGGGVAWVEFEIRVAKSG